MTKKILTQELEVQKAALLRELKKGEESDIVKNFDFKSFLKYLHKKYGKDQPKSRNKKD